MGNIVDIFARRMLLCLQRLDFNNINQLWLSFHQFKINSPASPKFDKFCLDQFIEDLNTSLEYYPSQTTPEYMEQLLDDLESNTKDIKISLLKSKNYARARKPFQSIQHIRRYFDQTLKFNIQKDDSNNTKENLCVLNMVAITMRMGFSDESLLNLSEALRLSQANGDEESINQCLIYLYQISFNLGHMKELQLLIEYSINHSLKLSNPSFLIQNCLNYWTFTRFIQQNTTRHNILQKKKIQWKDALHHGVKKLYLIYDQNPRIDQQNLQKNLFDHVVTYELTVAIIQASYGYIQILQQSLDRYNFYITDQIAVLQLEACEILLPFNPKDTLVIVSNILQSMNDLPQDIVSSVLLINTRLFNLREDYEAANALPVHQHSPIFTEKISLAQRRPPVNESKHIMVKAQQLLQKIEQLLEQRNFGIALWQISKLEEWAQSHELRDIEVEAMLIKIQISIQKQQIVEAEKGLNGFQILILIIIELIVMGTHNYNLQIQAKTWKLLADIKYIQEVIEFNSALDLYKKSSVFASKLGNISILKYCTFQMATLEKMLNPNELSQSADKFCRLESFTHSFRGVNFVSYLKPQEIIKLNMWTIEFQQNIYQ